MKYVEPNITFSSAVLREKNFPKKLYNLIEPFCEEISGSKLHYHIAASGTTTILRYRIIDSFIVSRLIRIYPQLNKLKNDLWSEDSNVVKTNLINHLFLSSNFTHPNIEENEYFNLFDSSVISCHKEAFPIIIREIIYGMNSGMTAQSEMRFSNLKRSVPFNVGGKATFCPYLFFDDGIGREPNLGSYLEEKTLKFLKSRTNSWLLLMRRKGLKTINREIVIQV